LAGTNSYSGGTTINSGTLDIVADASLGTLTGAVTFAGNGTLQAGATSVALNASRSVVINDAVTGTFDTNGHTLSIAGSISGNGSLAETGSGMLILSGTNTYAGGTTVSSGTLQVAGAGALPGDTILTVTGSRTVAQLITSQSGLGVGLPSLWPSIASLTLINLDQWQTLEQSAATANSLYGNGTTFLDSSLVDPAPASTAALAQESLPSSNDSGLAFAGGGSLSAVPEPQTLLLLAVAGLLWLPWYVRRRRSSAPRIAPVNA
jgi:autotransporter-associated beta strand protein